MTQRDEPLQEWKNQHKPNKNQLIEIYRWLAAVDAASDSIGGSEALEAWLAKPVGKEPDVAKCIADYGRSRIIIRGWKKLPIDVSEGQLERWRARGYEPTLEDVQGYIASAAGSFLEVAGHDPGEVIRLIRAQVAQKVTRMEKLGNEPLEYYTPREFDQEEIDEGDHYVQINRFAEVFQIREQLHCFELGMEYMRLFCFDEEPELGLPNKGLFAALCEINLNLLIGTFDVTDEKLRRILAHLAKHNDFSIEFANEPEAFWWRHYKAERRK